MTGPHVLAVDLGSTGVKVAVVDQAGRVRSLAGEVIPLEYVGDGGVEQDPEGWWQAVGRCGRRAVSDSGLPRRDVAIVAVTSQYTSTVAVAADGRPLAKAMMWMDRRGAAHNRAAGHPEHAGRWLDVHGLVPSGNDDIGHVWFIHDEWPDVYAAAYAFVEPMDYLAARLTGTVTATQNTMFPMCAVDNRTWGLLEYSDELLSMSELDPGKLPRLVGLGEPRGPVSADAAAHLGVSESAIVSGATIDSVTSAVGAGAIDASRCGLIIGTTSVMATHLPAKRHDPRHGLTTAPSPLPGAYFLVAENGIGGKALEMLVDRLVYPPDGLGSTRPPDAFDRVLAAAATVSPGSNGMLFFPWLVGSLAPGMQRTMRGGFVNLGLMSTRRDMARAVLEGVALNAAWLLPHFAALAEASYGEITLGGGGAQSALWGQILADVAGLPVCRLAEPTATNAHGAGLLALVECGHIPLGEVPSLLRVAHVHEPGDAPRETYRRMLDAFVDFHDRAAPFYAALGEAGTRS